MQPSLFQQLQHELGDLPVSWPSCARHSGQRAVAVCSRCSAAICATCLIPEPSGVHCRSCRTVGERWLPPRLHPFLVMARETLGRGWILFFLGLAAFSVLGFWLFPSLVRPRPLRIPKELTTLYQRSPILHKAYRLRQQGDLYVFGGRMDGARDCYERAEAAFWIYLKEEQVAEAHRLQVQLGIGRLREKLGDDKGAAEIYREVSETGNTQHSSVALALFYLAQMHELKWKDDKEAMRLYLEAKDKARYSGDMLDRALKFVTGRKEKEDTEDLYALAALTDTATSAAAYTGEILAGIERIEQRQRPPGSVPEEEEEEQPRSLREFWFPGEEGPKTEEKLENIPVE